MLNPAWSTTRVAKAPRPVPTGSESRNALAAILTPDDLLLDLDVPTKNRALQEIAWFVSARHGPDGKRVSEMFVILVISSREVAAIEGAAD